MRAASVSIPKPAEDSTPRQSLPLDKIKPVKPIKRDETNFASGSDKPRDDKQGHRRQIQVVKSEPSPPQQDTMPERTQPTPSLRGPTPEEVMQDPLVRSVLDVFEGEIKRVHPKNK